MNPTRQELRSFLRTCEELLSDHLRPRLTGEEHELILYYVNELSRKFDQKPLSEHSSSFLIRAGSVDTTDQNGDRKMWTEQLQLENGVLNAVVAGELELGAAQSEFVELLDEAVRSGARKVLIDGQQMTGDPGDYERFLYGEFAAWASLEVMKERNIKLKFAYPSMNHCAIRRDSVKPSPSIEAWT